MNKEADRLVRALLADPALKGQYRSLVSDDDLMGVELIEGLVYSYPQTDADYNDVNLTIYLGLGALGGSLWDREMRTLERITGFDHPGLPELLGGGIIPGEQGASSDAAYVRTNAFQPTNSEDMPHTRLAREFAQDRQAVLPHIWTLADALTLMHDAGIHHRSLWSGSLSVDQGLDGIPISDWKIRLARFEMSALFSNLLRSLRYGSTGPDRVRDYYLHRLDARSRVFAPPERLRFMFEVDHDRSAAAADIFGLGMMAVEWLLGPRALDGDYTSLAAIEELQKDIRSRINVTTEIPAALSKLLYDMLDPQALGRPTATEVGERLGRAYNSATVALATEAESTLPYLVAFVPGESDKTILRWGHITEPSATDEGRQQLKELIELDMRGAIVVQSPSGARNYVKVGKTERLEAAKTVIIGKELVWFTQEFERPTEDGVSRFEQVAIVLFVLERERHQREVNQLLKGSLYRELFAVEAIPYTIGTNTLRNMVRSRPSWRKLVAAARVSRPMPSDLQERLDSFQWYLDYQGALLDSREYPFILEQGSARSLPELRWDAGADRDRAMATSEPLARFLLLDSERPAMADFFSAAAGEDERGVSIVVRSSDRKAPRTGNATFYLDSTRGSDTVVLSAPGGTPLPAQGWLSLAEDRPSRHQLDRQAEALGELAVRRDLLRQLVTPTGAAIDPGRWSQPSSLIGTGAEAVVDILSHVTMFALQGPPGTGKTEVTSEAVARYLEREPGARVLVSAQSHDALDNLAERILRKLKMIDVTVASNEHLALRIAGSMASRRISPQLAEFWEDQAAPRLIRGIKERVGLWLRYHRTERPPEVAALLTRWLASVDLLALDLQSRVRRSANLVFATTGGSTIQNLVTRGSTEPFDWVVVEEAGRAWPTELALPLVRGSRWTLVGDHAQIGPYAKDDIVRLIDRLSVNADQEIKDIGERKTSLIAGFETFGSMFGPSPLANPPRRFLSEQFRMHSAISEVVSNTFYDGGLTTGREDSDHGKSPSWLGNRSLIWLDTEDQGRVTGHWKNDYEAEIVSWLVRKMRPQPGMGGRDLAVLTPYRAQVTELTQRLSERATQIETIDAFQGREADIVVASLVRDRVMNEGIPSANVGHLLHSGRTNVLLSRARDLMVIVGSLRVYEQFAGDRWARAVELVKRHGEIITVSSLERS